MGDAPISEAPAPRTNQQAIRDLRFELAERASDHAILARNMVNDPEGPFSAEAQVHATIGLLYATLLDASFRGNPQALLMAEAI